MITIYRHRRLDNNEIFYVGIGKTEKRAYSKRSRNPLWHNIVNKVGYKVEIVTTCESWEEACDVEKYLIKFYGRRDLGLGPLVNMTDGGDGISNPSKEIRQKMSEAHRGKPSNLKEYKHSEEIRAKISEAMKGIEHSEEAKLKMSLAKKNKVLYNSKAVLDTQTGVYYNSIAEASFYYDINQYTLKDYLNGRYLNKTNLIKT